MTKYLTSAVILPLLVVMLSNTIYGDIIADSLSDWSGDGTQGENGWINGWRNFTEDGGDAYDYLDHFIPFINDGSSGATPRDYLGERPVLTNNWAGTHWRLQDSPADSGGPWTELFAENSHPNGTNSVGAVEEHWTIRRWVADIAEPQDLELRSTLRATNTNCGNGTTAHLFQNGVLLDTLQTTSSTSLVNSVYPTVFPGDIIDIALTPVGADGERGDSCDGSAFRLTITDDEPPLPPFPPLADSSDGWSATGTQGENNWFNGYYNLTQDPDGSYQVADFIPFLNDGSDGATPPAPEGPNHWTGSAWELTLDASGPWTAISQEGTHPNGTNSAPNEEHWTMRRYVANDLTGTTPLALEWQMRKTNANGTGVTGKLLVNGTEVDAAAIAGNDATGFTRTYLVNANAGDIIDLALTPVGPSGDEGDGADGSANRLTLRNKLPEGPWTNPTEEVFADSAAEFSGNQGQDNWVYGYYDHRADIEDETTPYDVLDFIPFLNDGSDTVHVSNGNLDDWKTSANHWNGSAWQLQNSGAAGHGPWTTVNANGGHPTATNTGNELHWAVRRWVVEFGETGDETRLVQINGTCNNANPNGEGTTCRIFLDGDEIWSAKSNDAESVSLVRELTVGSLLDFAIDSDGTNMALDPDDPLGTYLNVNDGSDGTNFSVVITGIETFNPAGDFDMDGTFALADVDALVAEIAAGTNDAAFDMTNDLLVNTDDLDQWLAVAATQSGFRAPYAAGDANLDGRVDAEDLNALALNWLQAVAAWSGGDFTADGQVNAPDLNALALGWQTTLPTTAAAAQTVPEPSSLTMLLCFGGLALLGISNRGRH